MPLTIAGDFNAWLISALSRDTTCFGTPIGAPTSSSSSSAAAAHVDHGSLLGRSSSHSPYWPGTVCLVGPGGAPELVHTLDDLTRDAEVVNVIALLKVCFNPR